MACRVHPRTEETPERSGVARTKRGQNRLRRRLTWGHGHSGTPARGRRGRADRRCGGGLIEVEKRRGRLAIAGVKREEKNEIQHTLIKL